MHFALCFCTNTSIFFCTSFAWTTNRSMVCVCVLSSRRVQSFDRFELKGNFPLNTNRFKTAISIWTWCFIKRRHTSFLNLFYFGKILNKNCTCLSKQSSLLASLLQSRRMQSVYWQCFRYMWTMESNFLIWTFGAIANDCEPLFCGVWQEI